jgi:DNA polymerase
MDALALLRLQIEWGADEALDDSPVDRLRSVSTPPPASLRLATPPPASPPPVQAVPRTGAAERAVAVAAAAGTLEALSAAIAGFDGCALRDTATKPVLPAGDPDSSLLLIGDPPGAEEDRSGVPFAGPDGALLDRMLASIGLERTRLLATPLIPWRPPGGRPPSPAELAVCLPFLHRLIVLSAPSRILLLGTLAARTLLPGQRRRPGGGWTQLALPGLPAAVPTLLLPAPGSLAGSPPLRRDAWVELRRLRRVLGESVTDT